jgi:hypothetical protein
VDLLWTRTIERRTIDVKPLSLSSLVLRTALAARSGWRSASLGGLAPAARFFADLQPRHRVRADRRHRLRARLRAALSHQIIERLLAMAAKERPRTT